jgi:hypothetical protein
MSIEAIATAGTLALPFLVRLIPFLKCLCSKRELGIVVQSRSGLTTLVNSIEGKQKYSVIFIDLDSMVDQSLTPEERAKIAQFSIDNDHNAIKNLMLPKYADCRKHYLKTYKKKRIVVFSHSPDILDHIGIPASSIVSYMPSKLLNESILATSDETTKQQIARERAEILQSGCEVLSFSSYEDLAKQFSQRFKLKLKM